ncbi:hypothetical protein COL20_22995 [Bacillus sp. AFS075034]|nr:hypothetical protein CN525_20610 [Bacillus sp. AFS014408]PFW60131.1 hypothetical protein COL20_22995 [Bacillus sp. AFS075034]
MHRNGQGLFLPHARVKTKRECKCRLCFILHRGDLDIEKLKWIYIYTLFLGGQEHLAMHRSGQGLFLPHAKEKQKEQTSVGYCLFCIAGI